MSNVTKLPSKNKKRLNKVIDYFSKIVDNSTIGTVGGVLLAGTIIGAGIAAIVGLVMGAWWCMWQVWMYVIPQIYASGPEGFKHPSYWLFVGCLVLANWVRMFIKSMLTVTVKASDAD